MVYGLWSMVYDLWSMIYGLWSMVYGLTSLIFNKVESLLKQSPLISQAVVVGSGRKQVGALIVPDWDALKDEMKSANVPADAKREDLANDRQFVKRVQQDAVDLTRELSDYERVKRVYLLPREFSIDKGEMTPTLKIKRSVIDEKYGEIIDEICGS